MDAPGTPSGRWPTGLLLVAGLAAAWELAVRSGTLQSDAWPALSAVGAVFVGRAGAVALLQEFVVTIAHAARGYAIGAALGIAAGVAIGASRALHRALEPTLELLRVIPLPALIPPMLLALGLGGGMKTAIVALATFWPVLINTVHGVRGVDEALVETARTFGTPKRRFVAAVMLPAALPLVSAGLRIAIAAALITAVVTEMIAGGGGIGQYIMTMQNAARMAEVYAALVLLSLTGYGTNRALLWAEARLMPWYTRSAA